MLLSEGGPKYNGRCPQDVRVNNDWQGREYDDFVPGEVTKTAPSGDDTT